EEQTGGSLHFHGIIFGGWDIDQFRQHIHKPEIRKKIAELIDSQITCEIPESIKKLYPVDYKDRTVFASEPYPTETEDIQNIAAEIAMNLGHHTHSFSCWKNNSPGCRLGFPQNKADESYFAEIHCDPNKKQPTRKFEHSCPGHEIISDPPPYAEHGNPFEIPDKRKIVFGLKVKDDFEALQPPQQPLTTVCFQCNTSMQPLVAYSEAKSAFYYICKYCAKNPYEVARLLALVLQSDKEY
ncbi:MAG: hypothetical protein GY739_21945, partial [Mesoflavibacter sp.]|nr:hypothetical protein [Mesoflavibacter sp.]